MILFIIGIMIYALIEARMDFWDIRDNKPIYHKEGWFRRAGIAGILIVVMLLLTDVTFPALCLVAYGVFSLSFRITLNLIRGKSWDYVSSSNVYDSLFLHIFGDKGGMAASIVELGAAALGVHLYLNHL